MVKFQTTGVPDLKIELEKSEYINQRKELMKTLQIPKLSEAKAILGEPLAKLVFDECDEALKVDFGLEPLKGALGDLWVSPSDLLIGKVALKPPITRKHIQALTHQGILNIGADIEKKFLNEAESDKDKALATQKKNLLDTFEDSTKAEIKDVEARERAAAQREIERITLEFEIRLIDELNKLEKSLKAEFNFLNQNQEKIIHEKWEKKLEHEVQKTVNTMTEQFLIKLARHEDILTKHLKVELSKAEVKRHFDLGSQAADYQENIDHLKHNLECKNIANLMYILCMERRKCCDEKASIEKYYKEEINKLQNVVTKKNIEIKNKVEDLEKQMKAVELRETCVLEILKQFQKFINFALRAAPTQAEFLLSVEKMLVFELTNSLAKTDLTKPNEPCDQCLPWYTSEKEETFSTEHLHIQDYHNCFNELPEPEIPGEEPELLPSFYYKNKLYVREDFRNMISQSINISSSNDLWSKDVEILIDTLKKSVHSLHSDLNGKPDKKALSKGNSKISFRSHADSKSQSKTKYSKRVSLETAPSPMEKKSLSLVQKYDTVLKPSRQPSVIDYTKIGDIEKKPFLLGTKSSVELLIKKGSVRYVGPEKKKESLEEESEHECEIIAGKKKTSGRKVSTEDKLKLVKDSITNSSAESIKIMIDETMNIKPETEREPDNVQVEDDLVLDVCDSIVQIKMSMKKKSTDFNTQTRDSMEEVKESLSRLGIKPSKLIYTRDSVELLHQSKHESKPSCLKKDSAKSRSSTSWSSSKKIWCDTCQKSIHSEEVIRDTILEKPKKKSLDNEQSIKVCKATTPTVHDTSSNNFDLDILPKIYTRDDKPKFSGSKKRDLQILTKTPQAKVIGEVNAREHIQKTNEFTADRIHSLIALIKDHPNLIRIFTSCTR